MPKLVRYLIEGATVEAISEILREGDEGRQIAPAQKFYCRQDEMSEFFGNLDRYKQGGSGGGDRGAYLRLYNGGQIYDRPLAAAHSACRTGPPASSAASSRDRYSGSRRTPRKTACSSGSSMPSQGIRGGALTARLPQPP